MRRLVSLNARVGVAIRRTRERHNLTAERVAESMEVNVQTLYRIETDKTVVTMAHIEAAAKALGSTPVGLLREVARREHHEDAKS